MMVEPIQKYPAAVLTKPCDEVPYDAKARFLAKRLMNALDADRKGRIGVAAPQIGVSQRAFSYTFKGYTDDVETSVTGFKSVAFNPTILDMSDDNVRYAREGCLSFPGLGLIIPRPYLIKVQWCNYKGEEQVFTLTGMPARIVQHEIDHLDGVLIINRAQVDLAEREA